MLAVAVKSGTPEAVPFMQPPNRRSMLLPPLWMANETSWEAPLCRRSTIGGASTTPPPPVACRPASGGKSTRRPRAILSSFAGVGRSDSRRTRCGAPYARVCRVQRDKLCCVVPLDVLGAQGSMIAASTGRHHRRHSAAVGTRQCPQSIAQHGHSGQGRCQYLRRRQRPVHEGGDRRRSAVGQSQTNG